MSRTDQVINSQHISRARFLRGIQQKLYKLYMHKTSAIISCFQKMLIRSDSKQRDVLNREKHGFPCRVL